MEINGLEAEIGILCLRSESTVSVAESCTGGLICARITDVPGSSRYFLGGVVAYGNESKVRLLNVPPAAIEKLGAVSKNTAFHMAVGARESFGSTLGLSITGIAGPGGGTEEKPVGLVYIGISDSFGTRVNEFKLEGERLEIREKSCEKALLLLKEALDKRIARHGITKDQIKREDRN